MGESGGLTTIDWLEILKWICGAVAFLVWGYLNRLTGRVDKHDDRLNNHDSRITKVETHLGMEE